MQILLHFPRKPQFSSLITDKTVTRFFQNGSCKSAKIMHRMEREAFFTKLETFPFNQNQMNKIWFANEWREWKREVFSQSLKLSRQQSQIKETKFHRARDKIERNEFCVAQRKKAKRREREGKREITSKGARREKEAQASKSIPLRERERERASRRKWDPRFKPYLIQVSPFTAVLAPSYWPQFEGSLLVCVCCVLFCLGEKASASVSASGNGAGFEQMRGSCKWLSY
jgi:hypothetical protein